MKLRAVFKKRKLTNWKLRNGPNKIRSERGNVTTTLHKYEGSQQTSQQFYANKLDNL